MRKLNSQFITGFLSEANLLHQNGTYYGYVELDKYYCLAVAEGYDKEGGRESAKLAVDSAIEAFVQKPGLSSGRLKACLKRAHKNLLESSVRIRLKAGIILIVSDYTRFRYASCGNVMLYAMRNQVVYHQSATHTVYQTMVDEKNFPADGRIPAEETRNLYHFLGGTAGISVSGRIKLMDGDVLLAVTESFWSKIGKVEILDAFETFKSVDEFLGDLQELYLRGSTEDMPPYCLVAVSAKKVYKENTGLKKKIVMWSLIIVLLLAVGGTIFYFYSRNQRNKQQEVRNSIQIYEDTGDRYMTEFSFDLAKQQYDKAMEADKKLKNHDEKMQKEQVISEKINISTILAQAALAYEAQNYALAREEYKKALELTALYPEVDKLTAMINQKLKLANTGMEINNFIQSAAIKEAEGDLESAAILYDRAAAMLRIVDNQELLQQVQLALLRVNGQSTEAEKAERAKKRDEVIADANQTAALDAILAGDYETAIAYYTNIRDSYISMEENEKAEEVTAIILSLQKQQIAAKDMEEGELEKDKAAALEAALDGDYDTAIELYEKIRDAYIAIDDTKMSEEMTAMIVALKKQAGMDPTYEEPALEAYKDAGTEADKDAGTEAYKDIGIKADKDTGTEVYKETSGGKVQPKGPASDTRKPGADGPQGEGPGGETYG